MGPRMREDDDGLRHERDVDWEPHAADMNSNINHVIPTHRMLSGASSDGLARLH